MKLTAKIAALLALTSALLLALLALGIDRAILPRFAALEERMLRQDQERLTQALDAEFQQLARLARDWGAWDDAYTFMQGQNADFEAANITASTFDNIQLDAVLLYDEQGRLYRDYSYDRTAKRFGQHLKTLSTRLAAQLAARRYADVRHGIVEHAGHLYQLALSPILDSNGNGPARGTLIMVRHLDDTTVAELARRIQLKLSFHRLRQDAGDAQLARAQRALETAPSWMEVGGKNSIAAYSRLSDLDGTPALLMRVERPREIWNQGKSSAAYFLVFGAASVALAILAFLAALEWSVLRRLKALSLALVDLGREGTAERRIDVTGTDEIAQLAQSANTMLQGLQAAYAAQRAAAERQREQNAMLVRIATHPAFGAGDDEQVRRILVQAMCRGARGDRVSLWLRAPGEASVSCWELYGEADEEIWPLPPAEWFALDRREGELLMDDDSAAGPRSALLLPFRFEEWLGVLCVEVLGEHYRWRPDERNFLASATSLAQRYMLGHLERTRVLELKERSELDALTGLSNRAGFELNLGAMVGAGQSFALAFVDLDRFKPVNDCYGHAVGDWLLKQVAARLRQQVRVGDAIARLGGDEFTILFPGLADRDSADRLGRKIVQAMAEPFAHAVGPLQIGCSVGLALYPQHGDSAVALAHAADMAMYAAKQAGRGTCRVFEDKALQR